MRSLAAGTPSVVNRGALAVLGAAVGLISVLHGVLVAILRDGVN